MKRALSIAFILLAACMVASSGFMWWTWFNFAR